MDYDDSPQTSPESSERGDLEDGVEHNITDNNNFTEQNEDVEMQVIDAGLIDGGIVENGITTILPDNETHQNGFSYSNTNGFGDGVEVINGGDDSDIERVMTPLRPRFSDNEYEDDDSDEEPYITEEEDEVKTETKQEPRDGSKMENGKKEGMEITEKDNNDEGKEDQEMSSEEKDNKTDEEDVYLFIPPSLRDDAPLAGIINPEIEDIDPRKFFPTFHPNKILRFSRLLGSSTKTNRQAHLYYHSKSYVRNPDQRNARIREELMNGIEKPFKPNFLPPPPREEIYDEAASINVDESEQDRVQSDDDGEPPPWRYGPSQIWYDRMNVPPNPKHFDYGIKNLQKKFQKPSKIQNRNPFATTSQDEEPGYQPAEKLSDKSFLPVNLLRWEDDIIFDVDEARESFLKDYSGGKLPYCGWIALKNARTYNSFMKLCRRYHPKDWFEAEVTKDAQEDLSMVRPSDSKPPRIHPLISDTSASTTDQMQTRAQEAISLRDGEPTTLIQFRLPMGHRITGTFNSSMTIVDHLRTFVVSADPAFAFNLFSFFAGFPPKKLEDEGLTIDGAGLNNSVVNVRLV